MVFFIEQTSGDIVEKEENPLNAMAHSKMAKEIKSH